MGRPNHPKCKLNVNQVSFSLLSLLSKKNFLFEKKRNNNKILLIFALFAGAPKTFSIKVKPADNFPVNLYYLMDMSKSMEDDLDKLQTLGTKIGMLLDKLFKKL